MRTLSALLGLALAGSLAGQQASPPSDVRFQAPLSSATLEAWRKHITPTEAERAWSNLPWHGSLNAGLEAAAKAQRPLLLWTMNGHPFGCT